MQLSLNAHWHVAATALKSYATLEMCPIDLCRQCVLVSVWESLHKSAAGLLRVGLILLGGSEFKQRRVAAGCGEVHTTGGGLLTRRGCGVDLWLSLNRCWFTGRHWGLFLDGRWQGRRVLVELGRRPLPLEVGQGVPRLLPRHAVFPVSLSGGRARPWRRAQLVGGAAVHASAAAPLLSRHGGGQGDAGASVAQVGRTFVCSLRLPRGQRCSSTSTLERREKLFKGTMSNGGWGSVFSPLFPWASVRTITKCSTS